MPWRTVELCQLGWIRAARASVVTLPAVQFTADPCNEDLHASCVDLLRDERHGSPPPKSHAMRHNVKHNVAMQKHRWHEAEGEYT